MLTKEAALPPARLRQLFTYDPATGELRYSYTPRNNRCKPGALAGCRRKDDGYLMVRVDGSLHYAHRVAWAVYYGAWPPALLDHRNRDTSDNRIDNLRPADQSVNNQNKGLQRNNKTGARGVHKRQADGVYVASIQHAGRAYALGAYPELDAAAAAYNAAARRLHSANPFAK